uniref:Uncharacterized protein n=1 Tax=viral metagenome TaxID=1070528 RepID=A0A6C0EI10_9ZZZZ
MFGTSPLKISVSLSSCKYGRQHCTACPVP